MDKKEKKKLMTQVAKGEITKKEADKLLNPKKTHQKENVGEIEREDKKDTEIRKKKLNKKEVKQSHNNI